jgi:hydrogenase expression/formation protein HypE
MNSDFQIACPVPQDGGEVIRLAHGGGGRLMNELIARLFRKEFANAALGEEHDGAVLNVGSSRVAFTTDSYVVKPLVFPGGDIGSMAVNGTLNDLAMCGARPRWLSAGFIIEEGLQVAALERVVASMARAATEAGVRIVTGDTKVVDRGHGDGLFINTSGIGVIEHARVIAPRSVEPGDAVIVSGDLGRHGIAILSVREGLRFETTIASDCAALVRPVMALIEAGVDLHCLRDLTRGGLASALNEIAASAGVRVDIEETAVPVREDVRGACELLGLDPLHVACEGRFVAFVAERDAARALEILRGSEVARDAAIIGSVAARERGLVTLKSALGARRVLDMLSGEQLPRIC